MSHESPNTQHPAPRGHSPKDGHAIGAGRGTQGDIDDNPEVEGIGNVPSHFLRTVYIQCTSVARQRDSRTEARARCVVDGMVEGIYTFSDAVSSPGTTSLGNIPRVSWTRTLGGEMEQPNEVKLRSHTPHLVVCVASIRSNVCSPPQFTWSGRNTPQSQICGWKVWIEMPVALCPAFDFDLVSTSMPR